MKFRIFKDEQGFWVLRCPNGRIHRYHKFRTAIWVMNTTIACQPPGASQ